MIELTYHEQNALDDYNLLLKLTMLKPQLAIDLYDASEIDLNTIRYRCKLLKDMGYMEVERKRHGQYQQIKHFYKALKLEFDLKHYEKIVLDKRKEKLKNLGYGREVRATQDRDVAVLEEQSLAQPRYKHSMDTCYSKEKREEIVAFKKKERKEARTFVSGGTLNSVFLA